ncbi:MAG: UDP-N-acetylmuramate dehydrogenase [Fibrobacter sp.]|nr:UDP-N-acetylmuramate dehydrogenase [Fibrobacter sp.]
MCDKNTYKIGGAARYYIEPQSVEDVMAALSFAKAQNIPFFILGKGSNLLISDLGYSGLVVNNSTHMCRISLNDNILEAQAGAMLNTVVNLSIENGWAGLQELAGIPGTVGGAVIMNAGAFNSCIADTLQSVTYYDSNTSEIITAKASELNLGYRTSSLYGKETVILDARFKFSVSDSTGRLREIKQEILSKRKLKQPLEYPNCGSVFKRPPGNFAGTLIEKCGLKGFRYKGVEVSLKHANFIINRDNGCASDVRHLIITIQKTVFDQTGILLEPEVIFVGDYEEPLFNPKNSGEKR